MGVVKGVDGGADNPGDEGALNIGRLGRALADDQAGVAVQPGAGSRCADGRSRFYTAVCARRAGAKATLLSRRVRVLRENKHSSYFDLK